MSRQKHIPEYLHINPANHAGAESEEKQLTRKRAGMSSRARELWAPEIPGYALYWVNDYPGRVASCMDAGYEFVTQEEAKTESLLIGGAADGNSDLGTRIRCIVNKHAVGETPIYAYLMKLRLEFRKIDEQELEKINGRVDNAVNGEGLVDPYTFASGGVKTNRNF